MDSAKNTCCQCEIQITKEILALNQKLLGRKSPKIFCLKCLAEFLDIEKEILLGRIRDFKEQGCKLFE